MTSEFDTLDWSRAALAIEEEGTLAEEIDGLGDVLANTNLELLARLVAAKDADGVANALGLSTSELPRRVASVQAGGEAVLRRLGITVR